MSHAPTRLVGLGLISMHDVDEAIRELKRVVSLGLKGIMINASSPKDVPYSSRIFDKYWAVAQDVGTPVSLHILTGKERIKLGKGRVASNMKIIHEVQDSLTDIIYNGVCERHPELKLVSAENDIGWVAHYLNRLDLSFYSLKYIDPTSNSLLPSEYFRRQIFATFQDDRAGLLTHELTGADNLMWASDFPHRASTWPHSQEVIARNFSGIPNAIARKVTYRNAATLYGLA